MTATEELRALLEELGVRWTDHGCENSLWWKGFDGVRWHAENRHCVDGWCVKVEAVITPAQAVEATFGRGECKMQLRDDIRGHAYQDTYECSECGEQVTRETYMGESEPPHYCHGCGRKVVS